MLDLANWMAAGPAGEPGGALSVVPVLIGPLQTFIAILPGLLAAFGAMLVAAFKPSGIKKIGLFFWHQKVFTCCLAGLVGGFVYGSANNWWRTPPAVAAATVGQEWSAFRGGPARTGAVAGTEEPTVSDSVWSVKPKRAGTIKSIEFKTFYASPAVVGNRVYVSAAEKGPLTDQGAIVCLDADTGNVAWMYSPGDFKATFSSPAVAYKKGKDGQPDYNDGYVVCGEGLHYTTKARVTCLNLKGDLLWQYHTDSHVESSPCIADGRAYIGAGDDGYYCFELEPREWLDKDKKWAKPLWHVGGKDDPQAQERYKDCESSPAVFDGVCYVGLGVGGHAIVALDGATGQEKWRLPAEYPVFSAPVIGHRVRVEGGKPVRENLLFAGMGNGDFVKTAAMLKLKAAGEVWCVNLSKAPTNGPPPVEWKFECRETVLGGIAFVAPDPKAATRDKPAEGRIYFGSRDGYFYCVSTAKQRLGEPFKAGAPIVTSPAVGKDYAYFATEQGVLHSLTADGLSPAWEVVLGPGEMSSPALANGHVYVGSMNDGLRCIGRVEPPVPVWASGLTGGVSDRAPLAGTGRFVGQYPKAAGPEFQVTAPLMPLAELAKETPANPTSQPDKSAAAQPQKFLYAGAVRDGKSELVKLRVASFGQRGADPLIWRVPMDRPIRVPPAGIGADVYVVEGGGEQGGTIQLLDAETGQKRWSFDLSPGGSGQFAIDGRYLFVWTGPATLTCLDRAKGGPAVWATTCPGGRAVGAVSSAGGLLTAATATALVTLDGASGTILWIVPLPPSAAPLFGPIRRDSSVILATENGLCRISLAGGEVEWTAPKEVGKLAQPPVLDADKLVVVSDSGRLFVLDPATGQPWRSKDAWSTRRGTRTHSIRWLGPADSADTSVVPLVLSDRVLFFAKRVVDGESQSDLTALVLPEKYEAESSNPPTTQPNVAGSQPDSAAASPAVQKQEETIRPTTRRWCETGFMGRPLTPVVVIDGQAFFFTEKQGLVMLKGAN